MYIITTHKPAPAKYDDGAMTIETCSRRSNGVAGEG
jgi:hypothetical protein